MLPERYEVLNSLGEGGMGTVWRVRDHTLGRVVAMKVVRSRGVDAEAFAARFLREAQVVAQLDHPGIVPIYDLGELSDGSFYFTMKEVDGRTLGALNKAVHRASSKGWFEADGWRFDLSIQAFLEVCEAVSFAHDRGVVHRDLKPDNVMIDERGRAIVLDWGLAKVNALPDVPAAVDAKLAESGTQPGLVVGTLGYSPPEQLWGQGGADPSADVYALGAILYELLCAVPPHRGSTASETLALIMAGPPPEPNHHGGPSVPPELGALSMAALSHSKADRPSLAEIIEEIRGFVGEPESDGLDAFELIEELGRGGMGVVHRATQRGMGRQVALKIMHAEAVADDVSRERFQREVRALAKCAHANVVKVLTSGVAADGRPWLAMELLEGADLARAWRTLSAWSNGSWPSLSASDLSRAAQSDPTAVRPESEPRAERLQKRLAALFADAADGVQELHDLGIVHRDLKPSNLMLTADGQRLVVMDLGLAHLADATHQLTADHVKVLGTLRYMPPEQLKRGLMDLDHRADVYALGASLYELVTGRPMFVADTEQQLIQQVLLEEPVPARTVNPTLAVDLEVILSKATEKRREHRYPSAAALASDLRAFSKGEVISARPPSLARRAQARARRHPAVFGGLVTGTLLVLAAAAVQWDSTRTKTHYWQRLAIHNGAYVGVGPLDEATARRTFLAVQTRTVGGQTREIHRLSRETVSEEVVGFPEVLVTTAGEHIRQHWGADGRPVRLEIIDFVGNIESAIDVAFEGDLVVWRHTNRNGVPAPTGEGEPYVEHLLLDDRGWLEERRYLGRGGKAAVADWRGVSGRRMSVDDQGRVVKMVGLGPDWAPIANKLQWVGQRFSYTHPTLTHITDEVRFEDANGDPVFALGGNLIRRDIEENTTRVRVFDIDMAPLNAMGGCHELTLIHDGLIADARCFDVDGTPMRDSKGIHHKRFTIEGTCVSSLEVFDSADSPTTSVDGVHRTTRTCAPGGHDLDVAHAGIDGAPTRNKDGFARTIIERDAQLRPVSQRYFLPDGAPAKVDLGHHLERWVYDDLGNVDARSWFGVDGAPVLGPNGCHEERTDYNGDGLPVRIERVGVDGQLAATPKQAPRTELTYDNQGLLIEERHLDGAGRLFMLGQSFARRKRDHDASGRMVGETFYGADGERVINSQFGISRIAYVRNERGAFTEVRVFGTRDEPILDSHHGHVVRFDWDREGERIDISFFGLEDEPILNRDGYHRKKTSWDADNRGNTERYFDTRNEPMELAGGAHQIRYEDNREPGLYRRISTRLDGSPSAEPSVIDTMKDPWGNTIGMRQRTSELELFSPGEIVGIDDVFDVRNRRVARRLVGPDEQLAVAPFVTEQRWEYDDGGQVVLEHFFDGNGDPGMQPTPRDGPIVRSPGFNGPYHRREIKVNALGQTIAESFFGVDGSPMEDQAGAHHLEYDYHVSGQQAAIRSFGIDGPIISFLGAHEKVYVYDDRGRRRKEAFKDASGEWTARPDGVARIVNVVNSAGNPIEIRNYALDGEPVLDRRGVHLAKIGWKVQLDVTGFYFGLDEEPVILPAEGFHGWEHMHDAKGELIEKRLLGLDGELIMGREGFARVLIAFDEDTSESVSTFLDVEGNTIDETREGGARR